MKPEKPDGQDQSTVKRSPTGYPALAVICLLSLFGTFVVASSSLEPVIRLAVFAGILIVVGLLFRLSFKRYFGEKGGVSPVHAGSPDAPAFDQDILVKLQSLEDANEFFGASLKSSDMFRLVASRIDEMIPYAACGLFIPNEARTAFEIKHAVGENASVLTGLEIPLTSGLAGKVMADRAAAADHEMLLDKVVISEKALAGFHSSIAAPLFREGEIFGVLQLFGKEDGDFDDSSLRLLHAIGERFTPLFVSSSAFEKTVSSALTDTLTSLPNERAFFLVLENQIAEAQRYRDERPVTVLTIDIKNFSEINEKFGHAVGNDILSFAAQLIKNGLRRMDFLARSASDEFLTVLPTASEAIAGEVTERLEQSCKENPFEVSAGTRINIGLNFGSATFWKDGETANQLLKTAHLRKQQAKSAGGSKVIWFPKT